MSDLKQETASRGRPENPVFDRVVSVDGLRAGFEKTAANNGCAGSDGIDIATYAFGLDRRLKRLSGKLAAGLYVPGGLKVVDIDKPGRTERRTLRIPTVQDRVVQTSAYLAMLPILDPEMEPHSYAYRKGKSVNQALAAIYDLHRQGYGFVVDADIRAYFDNVPHLTLKAVLAKYVPEKRFLELLDLWLDQTPWRDRGLLQGSPVSPILANIYLDSVDEALNRDGFRMVRYADDFVVLCKSRKRADSALELVAGKLAALGLELHPDKTSIRSLDEGYRFLGASISGTGLGAQIAELGEIPVEDPAPMIRKEPGGLFVTSGEMNTVPSRNFMGRDISPKYPEAPATAEAADRPWLVEDLETYGAESEETAFDLDEGDAGRREHAPFIRPLYLMTRGSKLLRRGNGFEIVDRRGQSRGVLGPGSIDRIDVFPACEVAPEAIDLALGASIPIFHVNGSGAIKGCLAADNSKRSKLHYNQARHSFEDDLSFELAREFVAGRIYNQRKLIQGLRNRLSPEAKLHRPDLEAAIEKLERYFDKAMLSTRPTTVAELRNIEANATAVYWPALSSLVKRGFGTKRFKRTRLPADSAFNAVLNFTAYLLHRDIETLVLRRGLHPGMGILHRPGQNRHGLYFDLMEEFRAPVAEAVANVVLSTGYIGTNCFAHSDDPDKVVRIVNEGPKKIVRSYEKHVDHKIVLDNGRKSNWRGAMDRQISKYIDHVSGKGHYTHYRSKF